MESKRYWRAVVRHGWIGGVLMMTTVLGTAAFTFLSRPEYTAMATALADSPASSADRNLNFTEVATSNVVNLNVIRELHLPDSPDRLSQRIKVDSDRGSNLYRITVTDTDANRAAAIANAVAQEAVQLYMDLAGAPGKSIVSRLADQGQLYLEQYIKASQALHDFERSHPNAVNNADPSIRSDLDTIQIQQTAASNAYLAVGSSLAKAQVDEITNPSSFHAQVVQTAVASRATGSQLLKILYGAGIGLLIGAAAIFLLEYYDRSMREPSDAEHVLGAPVIGIIARGNAGNLSASERRA